MKNEIEELKHVVDAILIENNILSIEIYALTNMVDELSKHLLDKELATSLKSHFYHIALKRSADKFAVLGSQLSVPARASFAQLELESYLKLKLSDLG